MVTFPNAKINIGLQILNKRPDRYHNLETVFYPVSVYDVLEIVDASENKLFVSGISIPDGADNLCNRVYQLLKDDYKLSPLHIYLHKNIPIGAGLGGGSSDAAFLIKLINEYFDLKLNPVQMMDYARKVGADCAFFIENKPVFASGIGDEFSPVKLDLAAYHIILVKPAIHISTAEAFEGIITNQHGRDLQDSILQPISTWRETILNDFELSIFAKYPAIGLIKEELYHAGAIYASMSGSGSCVFGIFEESVLLPELEKSNQVIYC